jgi:hypothetical protein
MADDNNSNNLNNLNDLQNLMRQVVGSTKSMAENLQKQTSLQEKALLNTKAKEEAKRMEEYHREQQKKLVKLGDFGEVQKAVDEQTLDVLKELLKSQEDSTKESATAADYLKVLKKLTEDNKQALLDITNAKTDSRGLLGSTATHLSKTRDYFKGADLKTEMSGIGSVAGLGANLIKLGKMSKSGIGNFGARKTNKRIKTNKQAINDFKVALSAEKFELAEAKKSGDKARIARAETDIKNTKEGLKNTGATLSRDMTSEFMRQQSKSNPNALKGFDKNTIKLIKQQQEANILSSIMSDTKGIADKKDTGRGKGRGDTNGGYSSPEAAKKAKMMSSALNATKKPTGGLQAKFQAGEARERENDRMGSIILDTDIAPSESPSTYGEYVASTYTEIKTLNTGLAGLLEDGGRQRGSDDSGMSGLSMLMGGLIGSIGIGLASRLIPKRLLSGLGKMSGGKKTKVGKFFRNSQANKLRRQRAKAQKLRSRVPSTNPSMALDKAAEKKAASAAKRTARANYYKKLDMGTDALKVASKDIAKTTAKTGAKTAAKTAAKTGAKTAAKIGAKTLGKSVLKKIPILGALAGIAFGIDRAMSGDFAGAGLEVLSGLLGGSGLGIAGSVALDVALGARDMGAFDSKKPKGGTSPLPSTKDSNRIEIPPELRGGPPPLKLRPTKNMNKLFSSNVSDAPVNRSSFIPKTNMASMSQSDTTKVAEYNMLAKMIATENVKVMDGYKYQENMKRETKYAARTTADALKKG